MKYRTTPAYRLMVTHDRPGGDTQDPLITANLAEILAEAPALFDRLGDAARAGVSPESRAAKDANTPLGHHARILAMDHLSTGIEHLVVWHRLLTSGVQPYAAHMTLIRGAMEGAVTCRWLIDPRTDSADRVRRGVALLLEDYGNRRDFERDFGIAANAMTPPAKSAANRHAELQAQRDAAKTGRTDVPKMTALFGGYTGLEPGFGRGIYRLLSAYAHGKQWKGLTLKLQVVEDGPDAAGARLVKVSANDDLSAMLTSLAMRTATVALAELEAYCQAMESTQPK